MKEKRYLVTFTKYIYARNDNEAKFKTVKFADQNDCGIIKIVEFPFASFDTRLVHKGNLNIFENKII